MIGRTLRQIQLRVEDLERIGNRILRIGQDKTKEAPERQKDGPDSREKDRVYKPEGGGAPKAAEALRKGADAARGRGQRKSRWYQRTGTRKNMGRLGYSCRAAGECAAKAFYSCPAIISRRPGSQNTTKQSQLNSEKHSRRKHPRSHVTLEKSS